MSADGNSAYIFERGAARAAPRVATKRAIAQCARRLAPGAAGAVARAATR
jgi:hypothetical protein